MKRCLTSLVIREMTIKARRYYLAPTQLSKTKWLDKTEFLWEMGAAVLEGVQTALTPSESDLEISCKCEEMCLYDN